MPRKPPTPSLLQGTLFAPEDDPGPASVAPAVPSAPAEPAHPHAFAQVAINLPIRRLFDYGVPPAMRETIELGRRVRVPFHGRSVVGYVVGLSPTTSAPNVSAKDVRALVDKSTLLPAELLALGVWMSRRYFASVGECLEAMLPAGVRWERTGRVEKVVRLARAPAEVEAEIARVESSFPRRALLLRLLVQHHGRAGSDDASIPAGALCTKAQASLSPLTTLAKQGWVIIEGRVQRSAELHSAIAAEDRFVPEKLTFEQEAADRRLAAAINAGTGGSFLLHGVTGSGKTEIYLRAIGRVCERGQGAIVLVPEIALTPQLVQRFSSRFQRIAVLNSSMTDSARGTEWNRVRAGEVDVVIGPRSALFAPFEHLGLIVLDEEHEPSYKQESAPRYHAREVALERARLAKAVVVLGSATPSLETWFATQRARRHVLLSLPSRVSGQPLPPIVLVDMRQEFQEQHRRSIFSRCLVEKVQRALSRNEQVILFLNRRGYSTYIHCVQCGYTQRCPRCAINLTYHRQLARSWCHYCGETALAPESCPDCGTPGLKYWGFGTEKIAEELPLLFPGARIERMDSDTMTTRASYEQAFRRLRAREVDILMGTQMIAKGLDLPNVTLVGVLYADIALAFPDFRAAERTFQLIAQVAGRAGRSQKGGEVIVQCFRTEHYAIECAKTHDYLGFARRELEFRLGLGYPPYGHFARILFEAKNYDQLLAATERAAEFLRATASAAASAPGAPPDSGWDVLGPADCPISKLKDRFRRHLLLKFRDIDALLAFADEHGDGLLGAARVKGTQKHAEVRVTLDVDPVNMM